MCVATALCFTSFLSNLIRFGLCKIALISDYLMDEVVVLLAMDAGNLAQLALAVLDRFGQVAWSAVDLVD